MKVQFRKHVFAKEKNLKFEKATIYCIITLPLSQLFSIVDTCLNESYINFDILTQQTSWCHVVMCWWNAWHWWIRYRSSLWDHSQNMNKHPLATQRKTTKILNFN